MDVVGIIEVVVLSHQEAIALARHSFFPNPSLYAAKPLLHIAQSFELVLIHCQIFVTHE